MDNSPAWDAALARVPQTENRDYVRRDTSHVDSAQRPRQAEYDRYMYLVELFRGQSTIRPSCIARALSGWRISA